MNIDNKIVDFLDNYTNGKYNSTNDAVDAIKEILKTDSKKSTKFTIKVDQNGGEYYGYVDIYCDTCELVNKDTITLNAGDNPITIHFDEDIELC